MGSERIITSTPMLYSVDDNFDDIRFQKVRISVMHSGSNLNNSSFDTSVIQAAKDTFKNIAVLANVVTRIDKDGNETLDFGSHDGHFEDDKMGSGEDRYITDERVVGVVPESNDFEIVHDDKHDWDVPMVTAYIYKDYSGYVTDIIEKRGGKVNVSAEIYCPEVSVDAMTGEIIVDKMVMSGITLLGENHAPAMTGSTATVFSLNENDRQTQMIEVMRELKNSLDTYAAVMNGETNSQEGGKDELKLEELMKKFNVTEEMIDFETEGLSDVELEAKFAEKFGNKPEAPVVENTVNYTVNGKEFSVSLNDIQAAISKLVNDTYEEADKDWYYCDVYFEEKYVVMQGWKKSYRQSFEVEDDIYTLVGEREEVFATWMTRDEQKAFDEMKANYPSISEELTRYRDEPKKIEILNGDVYSALADDEDFKKLSENHFEMTIEDVAKKADEILLNSVKQRKFSYGNAKDETKKNAVKPFPTNKKSKRNFGSLFDGII